MWDYIYIIEEAMEGSRQEKVNKRFDILFCLICFSIGITFILTFFNPILFIILSIEITTFPLVISFRLFYRSKKEKD